MRKIPTLFVRDYSDPRRPILTDQVAPGCEWVLAGEGVARRKWDGTAVLVRRDGLAVNGYARRTVAADRYTPAGFLVVETDPNTGHTFGWEPIAQTGYRRAFEQALSEYKYEDTIVDVITDGRGNIHAHHGTPGPGILPGTYELVGPRINANPEHLERHHLIRHDTAEPVQFAPRRLSFRALRGCMVQLADMGIEGVVWHHPDGRRMAKLKVRDFGLTRRGGGVTC